MNELEITKKLLAQDMNKARRNAVGVMKDASEWLSRQAKNLMIRAEAIELSAEHGIDEMSQVSSAIGDLNNNTMGNCRLDLMATYLAKFEAAKAALDALNNLGK